MKRIAHTLAQAVDGKQAQEIGIPQNFSPFYFAELVSKSINGGVQIFNFS